MITGGTLRHAEVSGILFMSLIIMNRVYCILLHKFRCHTLLIAMFKRKQKPCIKGIRGVMLVRIMFAHMKGRHCECAG